MFYTDISDVIALFTHLELDENYQIYCYIGTAYHGTYGTVAAIKKGCLIAAEGIRKGHWGSLDCILPESAFPVMEAIYHDGTKAGYMEAVLFSLFVHAIPYTRHEQEHWDRIADKPPQDLEENWNTWYSFGDWSPRYKDQECILFQRKFENGIGASDGKDRIYATQYLFKKRTPSPWAFIKVKEKPDKHIEDNERYTGSRRPCVFTTQSILVAEMKER